MTTKRCTRCFSTKAISEFKKNQRYADGHVNWCDACAKAYRREHYLKNLERHAAQSAAHYAANREKCAAKNRANYQSDKARHAERIKAARSRNPEKYRLLANERARRARAQSPAHALRARISAQLNYCLKTGKGGRTSADLLGYTITDLRDHLERLFNDGMSWSNMGRWHIDHIRPIASFTITGADDPVVREAWALSNLQPLWALDNIRKGARWAA